MEENQLDITIENQDGTRSSYVIHRFPPIAGRRIVLGYPLTAIAANTDYAANEAVMKELMGFVSVRVGDSLVRLSTDELIANHVKDWYSLVTIELRVLKFNCSFLQNQSAFGSFKDMLMEKVTDFLTNAFLKAAKAKGG